MRRRKTVDIESLLNEFSDCQMAQTREILAPNGSVQRGNQYATRALHAVRRLRSNYGDEGREALKTLLHHESDDVRTAAAAFLLAYATKEAMAVLQEVAAKKNGLIAFEAQQALLRWEEGTWKLDELPSDKRDSR